MELDTFTVVIPCYNVEKYIKETINSVIRQTRSADEIIIIDDGSTDKTINKIKHIMRKLDNSIKEKIKIHYSHNRGPGSARNIGIKNAKSKWICFLDSDDTWELEKLETVEKYINQNSDINFLCHDEMVKQGKNYSKNLYSKKYAPNLRLQNQLYKRNIFSTSAVTCKKDLLTKYGLFNEELMSAQDYELWLRLSSNIKPLFLNEILGTYNMREGNITSGNTYSRMINEYKIAIMHRDKTSTLGLINRLIRISSMYLFYFIKRNIHI